LASTPFDIGAFDRPPNPPDDRHEQGDHRRREEPRPGCGAVKAGGLAGETQDRQQEYAEHDRGDEPAHKGTAGAVARQQPHRPAVRPGSEETEAKQEDPDRRGNRHLCLLRESVKVGQPGEVADQREQRRRAHHKPDRGCDGGRPLRVDHNQTGAHQHEARTRVQSHATRMDRPRGSLRLVEEQEVDPEIMAVHVLAEDRGRERESEKRRHPGSGLVAPAVHRGGMHGNAQQHQHERGIGLHRDQAGHHALQEIDSEHPPGHGHRSDQSRGDAG
jgi:hypothetical protein